MWSNLNKLRNKIIRIDNMYNVIDKQDIIDKGEKA